MHTSLTLPPPPTNLDDIITVSPSQLDVWYRCKYMWKLSYLEKWTAGSTKAQRKGGMTHLFQADFYNLYLNSAVMPTPMDDLLAIAKEHEGDFLGAEDLTMYYWAFNTFVRYADYAANKDDFIPLATEIEFYAPTGLFFDGREVFLHGIIDLLADRAGDLLIIDHKSYSGDRGKWTPDMVHFDQQLQFYALALSILGLKPRFGMINGLNTFEYKTQQPLDKLFSREEVRYSPSRLEIYKQNIFETITEMQSAVTYPKRWNKDCKRCGYREVCDIVLRGQDPYPVLQSKHSRTPKILQLANFSLDDLDADEDQD